MPGSRAPTVPAFARRLAIETPEHLALEIELAGPGSRVAAAACDAAILFAVLFLLSVGLSVLSPRTGMQSAWGTLVAVLVVLVLFFVTWGYFLLFEALNDGRTPGKRLLGIRVVMDTGHRVTFSAAAVRNLVRVVDAQPLVSYLVGLGFVLFHPQLKQLGAAAIPAFAAQYREVAADLARGRTYGVDPRVLEYLERVVSAGHNALYGRHTVERVRIGRLLAGELPAAVVAARAYVLAALLTFAVPAVTGYLVIRERPAVAEEVLPGEMIARAREGAAHRAQGVGYAETPSMYLPVVATRIITNNVQVAFFAFAFGITAGIGTVGLLTFNGLFFGA